MKKQFYVGLALIGALASASAIATNSAQAEPSCDNPDVQFVGYHDNDDGHHKDFQNFIGVVTSVRNPREFNLRYDGKIYNVYADNATRDLISGEIVHVYGRRVGDNDIRRARANISHDLNVPYRDDFQNFTGVVTNVRDARTFNIRYDGKTYNVYADEPTRHLHPDEKVRVNGKRVGDNDIRDAYVLEKRNR